jgi:CBS domain-containing protein
MLSNHKIRVPIVIEPGGDACGVVSQTDLVKVYGQDWESLVAEDVMTPDVIRIVPDIPVKAAAQFMMDRHIPRLLITMGGPRPQRPVGILSMSDIVREMAD